MRKLHERKKRIDYPGWICTGDYHGLIAAEAVLKANYFCFFYIKKSIFHCWIYKKTKSEPQGKSCSSSNDTGFLIFFLFLNISYQKATKRHLSSEILSKYSGDLMMRFWYSQSLSSWWCVITIMTSIIFKGIYTDTFTLIYAIITPNLQSDFSPSVIKISQ